MEYLAELNWWSFIFQAIVFSLYIPFSYIAYRWVRAPLKHNRAQQALSRLGISQTQELEQMTNSEYRLKHYFWPLFLASAMTTGFYLMVHPYPIQFGLWQGFLEEVINIFGADHPFPRDILMGRFMFWAWAGAYVYTFHLIWRRFLAYDLTPSVYVFTTNRFVLAFIVGGIVGVGLGTFAAAAGVPFNVNMATVSIVLFSIGFFPEQGINWIAATAQKSLKQQGGIAKEKALSKIEGLSIWHQGRLKQEGIENVQNLATADLPALVVGTPFAITQIVDWIDQAILLRHTSDLQFEALEKIGVLCASDVLTNTSDGKHLQSFATASSLSKEELKVLRSSLLSALNIKLVSRFRWKSSLDLAQVEEATALQASTTEPAVVEISEEQGTKLAERKEQEPPKAL